MPGVEVAVEGVGIDSPAGGDLANRQTVAVAERQQAVTADGALARKVGVSRVLPGFDGRRLDDLVDFLNYVIVPAVFLVATGLLPHWAWAAAPVLASAYGFSHVQAKT